MGKIFGISDNPVSTIDNVIKPLIYRKPNIYVTNLSKNQNTRDSFVAVKKSDKSNMFVKMRNGIGKLLPHFSKARPPKK